MSAIKWLQLNYRRHMARRLYSCHWSWNCHCHCDMALPGLATQADYQQPPGRCLRHVWMATAWRQCFLVFNANPTCCHSNTSPLGEADAPLSLNKDANYFVRLLCRLKSFFSLYVHVIWSFYYHNWRRVAAGMFIVHVINKCLLLFLFIKTTDIQYWKINNSLIMKKN